MGTTYWRAEAHSDIFLMIEQASTNWHKDLKSHGVKIGVIFALSADDEKPAVKHGGYPAIACVKLVTGKDKVSKDYEVEMLVDASAWRSLSSESKLAVIDHELAHVVIKKRKIKKKKNDVKQDDGTPPEEEVVFDDRNRPVLKLKKADWNVGDGFADVVARHGQNAVEYLNIKQAEQMASQAMKND